MNNPQARQMPLQVQKSLKDASLRSMEIQRQMAEARLHQRGSQSQPMGGVTLPSRILDPQTPLTRIRTPEELRLQDLLAHAT